MSLNFYATFTNGTNGGVTGLTPLITITKVAIAGGALTNLLSAATMSAVTNCSGMYMYNMTTAQDLTTYDYAATIIANSTVTMDTPFGAALWSQFASGGVAGVTFPATVASPTNITAGTMTNTTQVGGITPPANWSALNITAAGQVLLNPTQAAITFTSLIASAGTLTLNGGIIGTLTQVNTVLTTNTLTTLPIITSGTITLVNTVQTTSTLTTLPDGTLTLVKTVQTTSTLNTLPANTAGTITLVNTVQTVSGTVPAVALAANQDVRNVLGGVAGTGGWFTGGAVTNVTGGVAGTTGASTSTGFVSGSVNGNIGGNLLGGIGGTTSANTTTPPTASAIAALVAAGSINGNIGGNLLGGVGGTTGANTTTPPTAVANALAVWNFLIASATVSGSVGALLLADINAAISSRMATFTPYTGGAADAGAAAILAQSTAAASNTSGTGAIQTTLSGLSTQALTGAIPVLFTVNDSTGAPISLARVRIVQDTAHQLVLATGTDGTFTTTLDARTYTLAASADGYVGATGSIAVTVNNTASTFALALATRTIPTTPNMCTVWFITEFLGVALPSAMVDWTINTSEGNESARALSNRSDTTGFASLQVGISARCAYTISASIQGSSRSVSATIPANFTGNSLEMT